MSELRSGHTRVAVVGVGNWGKNLVRNFRDLGALGALCDERESVKAEWSTRCPDAPFYRSFREVLANPAVHAVALATPAVTHYELAKAALLAGKDVFVEKPLAIEVRQGEELVEIAGASRRVLMVGHILRYHPAILRLQDLIRGGVLGKIHYLYSNRLNMGQIRSEENILWSFAPHDISVMLGLLGEMPRRVSCQGNGYVNSEIVDATLSHFEFSGGVQAHIFVSWLHPVKEQKLVVVGSEKMAVFDDTAEQKLVLYPHRVEWRNRVPTAVKASADPVQLEPQEPLQAECLHFLQAVETRTAPVTDGHEGLRVLRVLDACQRALRTKAGVYDCHVEGADRRRALVHESAYVDPGAEIGEGTRVWHFSHIMDGARIGASVNIGQNVNIDRGVIIGNNVKIQNNVSVYSGAVIEDDVFLGPSCVLTNVVNPRSEVSRRGLYETTILRRGCSIGANATIVCGIAIGRYAFVGAGSVVTREVPDYALVVGSPARQVGWMSRLGHKLGPPDRHGVMRCPESGHAYREIEPGVLRCLDLDEDAPLPEGLRVGREPYRRAKREIENERAAAGS